jgi:hypothetical protein
MIAAEAAATAAAATAAVAGATEVIAEAATVAAAAAGTRRSQDQGRKRPRLTLCAEKRCDPGTLRLNTERSTER